MCKMTCSPFTTESELYNFTIGCYFSDYLSVLCSADLLSPALKYTLGQQSWIGDFKGGILKRSSPYLKDS